MLKAIEIHWCGPLCSGAEWATCSCAFTDELETHRKSLDLATDLTIGKKEADSLSKYYGLFFGRALLLLLLRFEPDFLPAAAFASSSVDLFLLVGGGEGDAISPSAHHCLKNHRTPAPKAQACIGAQAS
jgi:hypothetical protein